MLPRERVLAALQHREPDRIPWGEHSIDYNVYQDILGRETFAQAKMKETQAYWDGRRDEVVASIDQFLSSRLRCYIQQEYGAFGQLLQLQNGFLLPRGTGLFFYQKVPEQNA